MLQYEYKLMSDEIVESLLCINWKKEGIFKKVNIVILSMIATFCIFKYLQNPNIPIYILLSIISTLLLFYSLYISKYIRNSKAKKISRKGGIYKIKIKRDGIIVGDNKKVLFGNSKCHLLESENVITIMIKKQIICLPKRILNGDINLLKNIIKDANFTFLTIKTKGE